MFDTSSRWLSVPSLEGRRVLITGAARGIGAGLAERLHQRGARVALAGLEPELLEQTAISAGRAPWVHCDVSDRQQVDSAVAELTEALGGLDVVVANAGTAGQLPLVGGDPAVMEEIIEVNVLGSYYTLRAAGPHISHPDGYALAVSSLGAILHAPLLGAYSASKAAVEAIGNALRTELRPTGARVGVAYFSVLDTDMTTRGFGTAAATKLLEGFPLKSDPVEWGINAVERGIARRSRRIYAPFWVAGIMPIRNFTAPIVELATQRNLPAALEMARSEDVDLTTPSSARSSAGARPSGSNRTDP